jgi:hypothetical protein
LFIFLAAAFIDLLEILAPGHPLIAGSLQIGLLDPISLLYRSVNLALLPLFDGSVVRLSPQLGFMMALG